jgi:hypothetical protein
MKAEVRDRHRGPEVALVTLLFGGRKVMFPIPVQRDTAAGCGSPGSSGHLGRAVRADRSRPVTSSSEVWGNDR